MTIIMILQSKGVVVSKVLLFFISPFSSKDDNISFSEDREATFKEDAMVQRCHEKNFIFCVRIDVEII